MLDAWRHADDPGIDPRRLAASNALDIALRRREMRTHRLMQWLVHGFWAAICAAIVVRIVIG